MRMRPDAATTSRRAKTDALAAYGGRSSDTPPEFFERLARAKAEHVPGDFVDLHGFALKRLDHNVVTIGPAKVGFVSHARIDRIHRTEPHLSQLFWFSTLLDAAVHRQWILKLEKLKASRRVAHRMAEIWRRLEMVGLGRPNGFRSPLNQTDLADMCGTTPIHMNRALSELRRDAVETDGVKMVVIDSLNSYMQAMPGGQFLLLQMHELLTYLNLRGVVTLLILSLHGTVGEIRTDIDLSYLSDAMVHYRYFEAQGNLLKAISVIKSRTLAHETTIREFRLGSSGVEIGEPLTDFRGILSGAAQYTGRHPLLGGGEAPVTTA